MYVDQTKFNMLCNKRNNRNLLQKLEYTPYMEYEDGKGQTAECSPAKVRATEHNKTTKLWWGRVIPT